MHPINALLLAWVVAFALKRRNRLDPLGRWRWIAAAAASLFPYSEYAFLLMGPGAYAQAYHSIMWSALLLPVFAVVLALVLGVFSGKGWQALFPVILGALLTTWFLALCTEEGLFPLAPLLDWRVGLGLINDFDLILLGLSLLGIVLLFIFPMFDRDMARLTCFCALMYIFILIFWAWQAHVFGEKYARTQSLGDVHVVALPQPLSPLNWRVVVTEANGRVHDTLVNLGRKKDLPLAANATRTARIEALYKPKAHAVWRVYRRYGDESVEMDMQRRIRRAWHAWAETPFGWYGRYSVFDRLFTLPGKGSGPDLGCIGFKDIRYAGASDPTLGTHVICPSQSGGARVFTPADAKGGVRELIPVLGG